MTTAKQPNQDLPQVPEGTPIKSIYKKLQIVKATIGALPKDKSNPHFKSYYVDINSILEHLEPLLESQNLICLQPIIDHKVVTRIIDLESDAVLESTLALPEDSNPQKIGSAITYYRRYTLQSLLSLQAEDDDANLAAKNGAEPEPKTKTDAPAVTEWLSEEQFNKTKASGKKGIEAVLKKYDGKAGKGMKKSYRDELQSLLKA